MTRTDVLTSSRRPRRRVSMRRLLVLPIALLLATALVAPSYAASSSKEGLSGYNHPAKKEIKPAKHKETPTPTPVTPTPEPAKASSRPFTGFDLRWTVGFGLVLVGAGGSILVMQRRQRHSDR